MYKKKVVMEQDKTESYGGPSASEVEEGDSVGDFEVVGVETVRCEHDNVVWKLEEKGTNDLKEVPTVVGECLACGEKAKYASGPEVVSEPSGEDVDGENAESFRFDTEVVESGKR